MRTILAVAVLVLAAAAPDALAATRTVEIRAAGFVPARVTIALDDRVTWVNRDTRNHQVVADSGAFASPILRPGRRYTFTFRAAGTFRYRDALEPAERGTIVVQGPPPSVSLAASIPIVRHGEQARLTGAVSTRQAGQTVTIWAQPYGQTAETQVATLATGAEGVFDLPVEPQLLTVYRARWTTRVSEPISVQVRPRITLLPGRRGWFLARVTAARSFAGRWVYLQRLSSFGQWVSVRKYTLGRNSGRLFRIPQTGGTYRVFMTVNQAGVGYLESWSGTQRVRRR